MADLFVGRRSLKGRDMVAELGNQMRAEMDANAYKGDDWREHDLEQHEQELVYHALKLIYSARSGDKAGVLEHAADTANCAGMLADALGVFADAPKPGNMAPYEPMAGLHELAEHIISALPALGPYSAEPQLAPGFVVSDDDGRLLF